MITYYMLSAFYILYIYKIGFTSILKMTKVRKVMFWVTQLENDGLFKE